MNEPEQFWSNTKKVIRYIVPFAHPGNFQAGSILTIYGGDAQTVIRPDGTVELVNDEPCRDLFMHDVDEGQFECELPKGHSERHRMTGETWDSDSQSWIDWEVVWEHRLSP